MKLLTCHIENFGGLSDLELDFTQNPFVLNKPNGWGKSTLTIFIKVMFYGFGNEGKRSILENERKRYSPWQKGRYGGELTFEMNGIGYEVSRTFGAKEKEDEFSLRRLDTNLECQDFSAAIGEEIFKIDGESFSRTVFIAQNSCITSPTDSIHAKIGNLAENTDDINNYETVHKKLSDLLNQLSPTRKTGQIKRLETQIGALRYDITGGKAIDDAISECTDKLQQERAKREAVKLSRETIQGRMKAVSESKDLIDGKKEYERLCREVELQTRRLASETEFFRGNVPTEDEIQRCKAKIDQIKTCRAQMQHFNLTEAEQGSLEALDRQFASGCPDETEIQTCSEYAERLETFRRDSAELKLSGEEEARFRAFTARFGYGIPEAEKLQEYRSAWSQRSEKKSAIEFKRDKLNTLKASNDSAQTERNPSDNRNNLPSLLIIGVMAALAGMGLLFVSTIAGIIGVVIGAVLIAASFLVKKSDQTGQAEEDKYDEKNRLKWAALEQEIADEEAFIRNTEKRIQDFFLTCRIPYQESTVLDTLYELQNQIGDYHTLERKKRAYEEKCMEADYSGFEEGVRRLLAAYYPGQIFRPDQYVGSITRLSAAVDRYRQLTDKQQGYHDAKTDYNDFYAEVVEFTNSFGVNGQDELDDQLEQIRDHFKNFKAITVDADKASTEQAVFEQTHDVAVYQSLADVAEIPQLTELSDQLNVYSKELDHIAETIQGYEKQIEDLQEQRMEITEAEEELERIQDEKQDLEHRYQILGHTKKLLETSKENFTARYMGPVMRGFQKYYQILTGQEASEYAIDAHINITVREQGKQRDTAFLSVGYQDLIGLCMRMALVDVMFPDEKPFIIFDDSFVNLDDEKVRGGIEFLKEIAKEYQVIYFTCHESRS